MRDCRARKDPRAYTWLLRLSSYFFSVVIIAEIWGNTGLSTRLFVAAIRSTTTLLCFWFFMRMIRAGLERLVFTIPYWREPGRRQETSAFVARIALLIDSLVLLLVLLPGLLMIWGIYDSLGEATRSYLSLGFSIGSQRISVSVVLSAAGVLYGAYLASWIFGILALDDVLVKRRVERGVRHSIAQIAHYVLMLAGFLWAMSILGLEITKLTIMLGALGVGIGFGLQGVVNNFVSGLILLFERPVRVGDTVEIGGVWSVIKKIGLRSTVVQTFDNADLIIPNADLINNQVTNWTLGTRRVRIIIPVGVVYGSDVPLVVDTLIECAKANDMLSERPSPDVLFVGFGESSLDFELRAWVRDTDLRLTAKSELHKEIDRRFREVGIEIAFPQRDLHLRSVNESIPLRFAGSKTTKSQ
jgi:small-conductance mechanosensitive channel